MWITYYMLQVVRRGPLLPGVAAILIDAGLAWTLALASAMSIAVAFGGREGFWIHLAVERITDAIEAIFVAAPTAIEDDFDYAVGFLRITTLIPTIAYLALLVVIAIAKPIIEAGRRATLHFVEVATEPDPKNMMVFTLLSSIAAVLTLLAKLASDWGIAPN